MGELVWICFITWLPVFLSYRIRYNPTLLVNVTVGDYQDEEHIMSFDTGSSSSWIFTKEQLRQLGWGQLGGIPAASVIGMTVEETPINPLIEYVDGQTILCNQRVSNTFSIGEQTWTQTFGIVDTAEMNIVPSAAGLIGASLNSDFVQNNKIFHIAPSDIAETGNFLFDTVSANSQCRNGDIFYVPIPDDTDLWAFQSRLRINSNEATYAVKAVFDSGSSVIVLPSVIYEQFIRIVRSKLGIYLRIAASDLQPSTVNCMYAHLLPSIELYIPGTNGGILLSPDVYSVRIMLGGVATNNCALLVTNGGPLNAAVLGGPFFKAFVVEFNADDKTVGICQPVSDGNHPAIPNRMFHRGSVSIFLSYSIVCAIIAVLLL